MLTDKTKIEMANEVIKDEILWGYRINEFKQLQRRKEVDKDSDGNPTYKWVNYGDEDVHKVWFLRPPRSRWKRRLPVRYIVLWLALERAPTWGEYNAEPKDFGASDVLGYKLANVNNSVLRMLKMTKDDFLEALQRCKSNEAKEHIRIVYDNMHTARPAYLPDAMKAMGTKDVYLDPFNFYRSALFMRAAGLDVKTILNRYRLVEDDPNHLYVKNNTTGEFHPVPWDFTGLVKIYHKMAQHPDHKGGVSIPARYIAAVVHYRRYPTIMEYTSIDIKLDDTFRWVMLVNPKSFPDFTTDYELEDFDKDLFNPAAPLAIVETANG